jgi:PAS domain S-box-containing protein
MASPLHVTDSIFTELIDLRRQVFELQQALAKMGPGYVPTQASALGAAQVGTWEWDGSTNRVRWSPETEQIFGRPPHTFDGTFEGFLAFVHPDDRPRLSAAIATAVENRTLCGIEHRIITPDGAIRWVACRGRAMCGEYEPVSGMVGTIEDITARIESEPAQHDIRTTLGMHGHERTAGLERPVIELQKEVERRQQAESALKASEQRYQSLYEQTPFMYFTLTGDGTVLSVNHFGADQLGYRKDELIGRSILSLFDPKDQQAIREQLMACTACPYTLLQWEIQKIRNDGTRLWVKERARAIHDHTGQLLVLVVCEDITERKRTADQLHNTTRLLHTLVDESALPLVSLDRDARVTSWNHAATRLFGWSETEVLGRELPYIPLGEEALADALWQAGTRGELTGPIELRRRRKDGTLLDLLLWPVFVFDDVGELSVAVGVYVDQSDLKQAEHQLRQSEWAIQSLHEITSNPGLTSDGKIHTLLELVCRRLDLPLGFLTTLDGEELKITHLWGEHPSLSVGMSLPRHTLYCNETLHMDAVLAVEHAGASKWRSHPSYTTLRLECYIGTKLTSTERDSSTIGFAGLRPHPRLFSQADKNFLLLIARWISGELDRRHSDLALRRSETKFRTFVETTRDLVWEVDEHALYTYASPRIRDILGYNPQDVIGKTPFDLMPPDEARRVAGLFTPLAATRQPFTLLEHTNRHKTGRLVVLETSGTPIFDSHGVFRGYHGIDRDITDRKRAEEALRASELMLQRFVAEAPVGLCILDEHWRAISANKALCELTGYDEQEIVGSTYALYTHPDDLAANIVLTDEFFRGMRKEYTYEKRYIRKSGDIIWVSVRATRIELSGHAGPLLLAAVQDITQHKLAMEEREHLSRDLHDNILQALYAVGMQLEAGKLSMGKSPRRSKIHLAQAVDQLNNLMLDVRRFIALLTQRAMAELDFGQALRKLIVSMSDADHATPELDIANPVLSFITPELGEQLLNIVREALSNSIRHARASHRWVRLHVADNAIHLMIGDNGIGFHAKRKRRAGHGLGNMAARAKEISATFTLESEPGKGTNIVVAVPLKKDTVHE